MPPHARDLKIFGRAAETAEGALEHAHLHGGLMKIWTLAGLGLAASLLASGCAPAETSVAGPERAAATAPEDQAPPTKVGDEAVPSGDAAGTRKNKDSAAKSDARSIATMMETYYTDSQAYPTELIQRRSAGRITIEFPHADWGFDSVKLSPGTAASVRSDGQSYCITMTNPAATRLWIYKSDAGGFQTAADAACDAEDGVAILGS